MPTLTDTSPAKRITNPLGLRVAQPAKTFPPRFHHVRFGGEGKKLTPDEWQRMQAHFRKYPEDRYRRGEQRAEGTNEYFICYSPHYPRGERWGTKEQLAKTRKTSNRSASASRKRRAASDEGFRTLWKKKLDALKNSDPTITKEDIEAMAEARAKKRLARFKAARSIKRKKGNGRARKSGKAKGVPSS